VPIRSALLVRPNGSIGRCDWTISLPGDCWTTQDCILCVLGWCWRFGLVVIGVDQPGAHEVVVNNDPVAQYQRAWWWVLAAGRGLGQLLWMRFEEGAFHRPDVFYSILLTFWANEPLSLPAQVCLAAWECYHPSCKPPCRFTWVSVCCSQRGLKDAAADFFKPQRAGTCYYRCILNAIRYTLRSLRVPFHVVKVQRFATSLRICSKLTIFVFVGNLPKLHPNKNAGHFF